MFKILFQVLKWLFRRYKQNEKDYPADRKALTRDEFIKKIESHNKNNK